MSKTYNLYTSEEIKPNDQSLTSFWIMVQKEIVDHIRSWRVLILIVIIFLTAIGSMYTAFSNLDQLAANNNEVSFFFLKLFTISDGTLPSFFVFIAFLGPLMGLSMGFDAVNSELNKGTLSRMLAQPIPRDYVLNTKFVGALIVIGVLFFSLTFLILGAGLVAVGIPPSPEEVGRIFCYTLLSIVYVAFWLNLSILFSVRFKQPATSALAGIAVWLFFTVFYPLIINMIAKAFEPSKYASTMAIYWYEKLKFGLKQVMPNELFSEATTVLLSPSIRSLGPLTVEQLDGAIPGALPLDQSLLLIWPQLTGLIAITVLCFAISYYLFMRREIRSR